MRALIGIVGVVCAVAALWLAFATSMEVSMAGFPDGHVTDYAKAVRTPLQILTWVQAGFAVLFLALALSPIGARARGIGFPATLIAFVVVAAVAQAGVPWYFGSHLGLDNGIGG